MIAANRAVFAALEDFCARRGQGLATAGNPRWITGDGTAQNYLRDMTVGPLIKFGHHRCLVLLGYEHRAYIGVVGFDFEPSLQAMALVDPNPGVVVCILSECGVRPIATPALISNIVEVANATDVGYAGHDAETVSELFPSIQLLQSTEHIEEGAAWRIFLSLAASECEMGGSWIDDMLASELSRLADLDVPELPYREICRAVFDLDPRALFMALYRCIEATYAFESCMKLIGKLGLGQSWQALASALESEIGWHPTEAASLNIVLSHAEAADLETLADALKAPEAIETSTRVGRALYNLRNRVVHYRLGMKSVDVDKYDWNVICVCLIRIVYSLFTRVVTSNDDSDGETV